MKHLVFTALLATTATAHAETFAFHAGDAAVCPKEIRLKIQGDSAEIETISQDTISNSEEDGAIRFPGKSETEHFKTGAVREHSWSTITTVTKDSVSVVFDQEAQVGTVYSVAKTYQVENEYLTFATSTFAWEDGQPRRTVCILKKSN